MLTDSVSEIMVETVDKVFSTDKTDMVIALMTAPSDTFLVYDTPLSQQTQIGLRV
jgi:hypothetical protein